MKKAHNFMKSDKQWLFLFLFLQLMENAEILLKDPESGKSKVG
jgi:hypothetical protein